MSFLAIFTHCCGSRHQGIFNLLTECLLCSPAFHTNKRPVRYTVQFSYSHTPCHLMTQTVEQIQATEILPNTVNTISFLWLQHLGVLYCVWKRIDKLYIFSGKMCRACKKDVSGHEGILVKIAQNRLRFRCTQVFSSCRRTDFFQTRWDASNLYKALPQRWRSHPLKTMFQHRQCRWMVH